MNIIDWIKNLVKQPWFITLLKAIIKALSESFTAVGKEAIDKITAKIKEAAKAEGMSNTDKFLTVYAYAKTLIPSMSESALRLLIESLVTALKSQGTI